VQRCDDEVIDRFPAVAAGNAGDLQSPPIVTTLAACVANASESEDFSHKHSRRNEMGEGFESVKKLA
jgi:hypothetical protein